MKPRLLDLFCKAGGATKGYQQAGFYVVGVDIEPQPHYCGDEFIQADAMTFPLDGYDLVHASVPCQGYSVMRHLPWLKGKEYPMLIEPMQTRLEAAGVSYVMENVMGAQSVLQAGWLCGQMFGLPFFRHRLFATNWFWLQPGHPIHTSVIRHGRLRGGRAREVVAVQSRSLAAWQQGNGAQKSGVGVGHAAGWRDAAEAMQIDWMSRDELTQAIPPTYTEYIGRAWLEAQR